MRNRFDSIAKIPDYAGPLLQTHGADDTLVPPEEGRTLFDAATAAEPKRFLLLPACGHNDPRPLDYYDTLRAFVEETPPHDAG